jgi:hypothetical protein
MTRALSSFNEVCSSNRVFTTLSLRRRCSLVVLALLLSMSVTPTSSSAVTYWNIGDARGDARPAIDVERTFLSVAETGRFNVRIEGVEFVQERLNFARVYFDTWKENAGPEFRVSWWLPNDGDGKSGVRLDSIDTWSGKGMTRPCDGIRRSVDYALDVVRFSVPRSCLGRPTKVRWAVMTGRITEYYDDGWMSGYWDFVPREKAFIDGFWVG